MGKSKTGNLLTILLFLVIVIIIICIGYFSYEIVSSKIKIKAAENVFDEFDREYPTIADDDSNGVGSGTSDDDDDEYADDDDDDDDDDGSGSGSGSSSKKKKKKKTTTTTTYYYYSGGTKKKRVTINNLEVIGTIRIPAIGIKYPILKDVSKKALDTAVVLLTTENGINKAGTSVIIGHNYRNWQFFSKNDKLKKGDIIYVKDTSGRQVKYKVTKKFKAASSDASFYVTGGSNKKTLILSTCTDDAAKTNKRLIIKAEAVK